MARGSRSLSDEEAQRVVKLWSEDLRFGNRWRFATRLAEILNNTATPNEDQKKAADKRLKRLEQRLNRLTNVSANAIAKTKGISLEKLEGKIFGGTVSLGSDTQLADHQTSTYRHIEIIHEFDIYALPGHLTQIRTAERVEVLKPEIKVGGSFWTVLPRKLRAFYKYARESEDPWKSAVEVKVSEIKNLGQLYEWDAYYEPALLRGEEVWFLTSFQVGNVFRSKICRNPFHAMEAIESFTWKIKFPPQRPAIRWWATVEYHPSLPSNATLESHRGTTREINWVVTNLPKGVIYFLNWEW